MVATLRESIADLDKNMERVDAQLTAAFPDYAGLASPKPLATADVQALLNVDEALVLFLDVRQLGDLPEETLVWVVTKKGATWYSVPLGTRALSDSVLALRWGEEEAADEEPRTVPYYDLPTVVQDFTATQPDFMRMSDADIEQAISEIKAVLRKIPQ